MIITIVYNLYKNVFIMNKIFCGKIYKLNIFEFNFEVK